MVTESARSTYELHVIDPTTAERRTGQVQNLLREFLLTGNLGPSDAPPSGYFVRVTLEVVDLRTQQTVMTMPVKAEDGAGVAALINADLDRLDAPTFVDEWGITSTARPPTNLLDSGTSKIENRSSSDTGVSARSVYAIHLVHPSTKERHAHHIEALLIDLILVGTNPTLAPPFVNVTLEIIDKRTKAAVAARSEKLRVARRLAAVMDADLDRLDAAAFATEWGIGPDT